MISRTVIFLYVACVKNGCEGDKKCLSDGRCASEGSQHSQTHSNSYCSLMELRSVILGKLSVRSPFYPSFDLDIMGREGVRFGCGTLLLLPFHLKILKYSRFFPNSVC